ncbi:MAG: TIGR03667 family PPOX class F420-dependent oxidoreductase [Candidatus Dormibacteraeota bacterium]|uniref:TIGR03667 family PPOX class F420-dependent oxidoreductase n=1 Tax=Candidatus Dormiibacter inghamiae TaxID=3127013 RepID=A0A934NG47_9BACT|nr:TIGR03667 family PPOX class F420-dependent oxidoreductase [Candidatus Dormibacteraeota bacterium]MBJ7606834.1 TIGR03667 family PPOX class F420-dependent oxidoreductase [Candidatus Dormibacteraeota bacterium]
MAKGLDLQLDSDFGQRVQRRLREEPLIWLSTTGRDGTPQPNPVWFLWDGQSVLVYNRSDAARLKHIESRPRVALNFNANGQGGDIVVLTGRAELTPGERPSDQHAEYIAKYRVRMEQVSRSVADFARSYPVSLRVWPDNVRGY